MTTFVMALAFAIFAVQGADEFSIVKGDDYQGAIVPATSPWHGIVRGILRKLGGRSAAGAEAEAWTPAASNIAVLERELTAFVRLAAREPARVGDLIPDPSRSGTLSQLPWLRANLATLTRQYYGVSIGGNRHVLVHGFRVHDSSPRWRSESIVIMDGACGNVWFDFNLEERRVVRFECGALAIPALGREE